ncbi:hypothetical protein BDY19DRAFT_870475, partial [Irpex rosettiformis]
LLQARTAELKDAQQYLGKSDAVSYAEVQRMVEGMNSEIFQLSAQFASICERVGKFVGSELTRIVATLPHADDPMLVQVMIQAYLARRVSSIVKSWVTELSFSRNQLLSKIHKNILHNESQAVSARWRTLTRRYIDPSDENRRIHAASVGDGLVYDLSDILALSGVAISGAIEAVDDRIRAVFGEKLTSIVNKALEINKVVGEEISTNEFEVICPRYGEQFLTELMEDTDDAGARSHVDTAIQNQAAVLCTTDLGLRRYGKKGAVGRGEQEVWENSVLLKAKVALPSLLEDFE